MAKLVALNSKAHADLKVLVNKIEALGARERMVPVVLSEFLKLCVQYPIVFTKNADTGQFLCVALLGFETGENLFWKNDDWDAIYIPLNITRQPFFLGHSDAPEAETLMCIDIESDTLSLESGEPIFSKDGTDGDYLTKVKGQISQLLDGEQQTEAFINQLLKYKLLTSLSLDITFANQQTQRIQGIYSIDEEVLESLSQADIFSLHQAGYLKSIYAMVASLGHIYSLIQKKNSRLV